MKIKLLVPTLICLTLFTSGCGFTADQIDPGKITSINIIDRNGLSETISSKERLTAFDKTDFLAPQPYQKVLRVYGREKNGDVHSCITSYHPNGQLKQCLEAVNNRAFGSYKEWYPNGQVKISATVIGGSADLNTSAEQSWLFDGLNQAWNEEGGLIAKIPYQKGELQGEATYFHPNGKTWKSIPYDKGVVHGCQKIYLDDGSLFQTSTYSAGEKEGESTRHWSASQIAYRELYKGGLLKEAAYYDRLGSCVARIENGKGERAIFGKTQLEELQQFDRGVQDGKVRVFDESDHLIRLYSIKNGMKHGEEIDYFPNTTQPKLLLTWNHGVLQGSVKTWYENGTLESQREMSANKKNGLLTAWFRNGALMLVEDYEGDKLLKGEYYREGEKVAVSKIEKGKGVATLFTPEGNFSRKVYYQEGKPID
ncbi:MAG: hypothetical protein S4CHLAM2_17720 [Chlamydiales bacterium]|nr:hypothetical protein [Chlamydiales bacterium]